jgi:hypothetical protein
MVCGWAGIALAPAVLLIGFRVNSAWLVLGGAAMGLFEFVDVISRDRATAPDAGAESKFGFAHAQAWLRCRPSPDFPRL